MMLAEPPPQHPLPSSGEGGRGTGQELVSPAPPLRSARSAAAAPHLRGGRGRKGGGGRERGGRRAGVGRRGGGGGAGNSEWRRDAQGVGVQTVRAPSPTPRLKGGCSFPPKKGGGSSPGRAYSREIVAV